MHVIMLRLPDFPWEPAMQRNKNTAPQQVAADTEFHVDYTYANSARAEFVDLRQKPWAKMKRAGIAYATLYAVYIVYIKYARWSGESRQQQFFARVAKSAVQNGR
jgi:hypothetical protein